MEKVFSPPDEDGHSLSYSSPSTHRPILTHFIRAASWTVQLLLWCHVVHQINAHCFLCFYSTHHINGLSHGNTGSIHMLLACCLHAGHAVVCLCLVTGVVFQLWFTFIDQTLRGALTLSDKLSVIGGWIMHTAAEWTGTLFWFLLCGKHAPLFAA